MKASVWVKLNGQLCEYIVVFLKEIIMNEQKSITFHQMINSLNKHGYTWYGVYVCAWAAMQRVFPVSPCII